MEEEGKVRGERRRSEKEMKNCNKRRNTKNRKYHCKLNCIARVLDLVGGAAHVGVLVRMRKQERYEDGLRRWCFGRGCIVPASSVSVQLALFRLNCTSHVLACCMEIWFYS